jgi:branched-chain amino acid transport system substrate-binding protein
MKIGVDAAVKAINASGGINGEPLGVLAIDDACDTRRAVEAAKEFLTRDVRGVIGHYCSGTSLAAALVYKERGIPMISPTATATQLTDARHWNVFRLAARDDALAILAAKRINAMASLQTSAYIGDGQPASETLLLATKTQLPNITAFTFRSGAANIAKLRQDLNKLQPNAIILGVPGAEAARIMPILADISFTGRVYGGEGLLSDDFTNRADVLNYEVLAVIPADPMQHQLAAPVIAELTLAGLEADGAALPAYAATQIFTAAAKATSINDGKAMAQWLRNGQNVDTILGKVSFDANGDVNNPAFTWYRWVGVSKRFLPE